MRNVSLFLFSGFLFGCAPGTSGTTDGGAMDSAVVNTCPKTSGAGTKHADRITADTTWAAADNPHIVTFGFTVDKAATLTLQPCVEVRFQTGGIVVDGKLVADGTPSNPITLRADDPSKPWSSIRSFGSIHMENVTLSNGAVANDPNSFAVIDARGTAGTPTELLHLVNVTIDGSQQWGLSLRDGAMFTSDSHDVTIKNATNGAIRAQASVANNIPKGSYKGNGVEEITIIGDTIATDSVWHAQDVRYTIGDSKGNGVELRVGANSGLAKLTIESGAVLAFRKGGRLLIPKAASGSEATGALIANNVKFTSAEANPAPGDWTGLYLAGMTASATKLDTVRVEYAGGPSGAKSFHCDQMGGYNEAEDAAIIVLTETPPPSSFVTGSTIVSSAGFGIDRGWTGNPVDFTATNMFDQNAKCAQSYPRPLMGSCPTPPPCP